VNETADNLMEALPKIITQFATLGKWGYISGIVLVFVIAIGVFVLRIWLKKEIAKATNRATQKEKVKDHQDNRNENQKLSDQIKEDEDYIKKLSKRVTRNKEKIRPLK